MDSPPSAKRRIYHFDNFTLSSGKFELRHNNTLVELEPQVFDLILHMVSHSDRVITKEELFDHIWKGRNVSDAALANRIKQARSALGDNGTDQKIIQTLHGRGFRFIPEVVIKEDHASADGDSNITCEAPTDSALNISIGSLHKVTIGTIVLVILCVYILFLSFQSGEKYTSEEIIILLPFRDLSPDEDQEYLAESITESILIQLAKNTAVTLGDQREYTLARADGGDNVLSPFKKRKYFLIQGSVQVIDGSARINILITQDNAERVVWSNSFTQKFDEPMTDQSVISNRIAEQLSLAADYFSEDNVSAATTNPEAFSNYVKAMRLLQNWREEDNLRDSMVMSRKAIALDPNFAKAHLTLAEAYLKYHIISNVTKLEAHKIALESAKAAISMDPGLSDAYAVTARIYDNLFQWGEAREMYLKALELDPDNWFARTRYVDHLVVLGYMKEALPLVEESIVESPRDHAEYVYYAVILEVLGLEDEATEFMLSAYDKGAVTSALWLAEEAIKDGKYTEFRSYLREYYQRRNAPQRYDEKLVARTIDEISRSPYVPYSYLEKINKDIERGVPVFADMYFFFLYQAGQAETALQFLSSNEYRLTPPLTLRYYDVRNLLRESWSLKKQKMRDHPMFANLLEEVGVVSYWEKYGPPENCEVSDENRLICRYSKFE